MGEMEFGSNYTHIGLPTFSKSYLQRNGIYSDKIYRKLNAENVELSLYAKQKLLNEWMQAIGLHVRLILM